MNRFTANVVIHFSGSPGETKLREIAQAMRELQGVGRVAPSPRLSELLLVDYDPTQVRAQSILARASRQGMAGMLVGL